MKKSTMVFIIGIFLVLAFAVVYIFSELYSESEVPEDKVTDAMKFKDEYEDVNGQEQNGVKIRELSISKNNPFIYKTADEIAKMIEEDKTFIVYFGFAECPWCRSILPSLIESASEHDIDTIYYVNVKDIRDKFELDDNNKAVRTVEGTEGYYKLLELLDPVLDDYQPLTYTTSKNKTKKVEVGEKRIYAPNVVVVKNGNPISLETGISKNLTDPYMELTSGLMEEIKCLFDCLFDTYVTDDNVCTAESVC